MHSSQKSEARRAPLGFDDFLHAHWVIRRHFLDGPGFPPQMHHRLPIFVPQLLVVLLQPLLSCQTAFTVILELSKQSRLFPSHFGLFQPIIGRILHAIPEIR